MDDDDCFFGWDFHQPTLDVRQLREVPLSLSTRQKQLKQTSERHAERENEVPLVALTETGGSDQHAE